MASVGTGVAVVLAMPFVIYGAGFTTAGVAAGSCAATLQTPFTAASSLFAMAQSVGVVGMGTTTKVTIATVTGTITYATSSYFSKCEAE
uniref:Uncharacterized protein n=1 Tax=Magallana gigas TaxID=29159 RepID=A0A8W8MQ06_MAGGI